MKINIKTVAERAQVSVSTVSRVLNSPEVVGEEARQRVMAAMKELNYQPSAVARSLSSQKSRSIGVIVPGIDKLFFLELHKGIHVTAAEAGLDVLIHDANRGSGTLADAFLGMKRRQMDGIIFSSAYLSDEYAALISRLEIPTVLVLTESSNPGLTAYKVDDNRASFDAVSYLVSRGHRNILLISGPLSDVVAGQSRYDGYCAALHHYDIPVRDELVVFGDLRFEHGYAAVNEFLRRADRPDFTAVFAVCDEMAIGAMRALHEHGLRVPEDVSVMGFDDVAVASMVTPKLTTVAQPFYDIGVRAVDRLVDIIDGNLDRIRGGVHYLPHQVIGRESVTTVSRQL